MIELAVFRMGLIGSETLDNASALIAIKSFVIWHFLNPVFKYKPATQRICSDTLFVLQLNMNDKYLKNPGLVLSELS